MTIAATRAAGLERLSAFIPRAGQKYAATRNTDPGPGAESGVSGLSPWLRRRLLLEPEVVAAAQAAHGPAAERFVEEVFWRTYWKGYLQQHPDLWLGYRAAVARDWNRLATEGGLRRVFADATEGRTGIACFDAWARALVEHNWLHNHARMWFASIWIFTLRLPWALGADFFARHLLDGDPASNTLSWRWVAGLHTSGKPYVARAENIARFTNGSFDPRGDLDEDPSPLPAEPLAPLVPLPPQPPLPSGDFALLLHEDDLCAESLDLSGMRVRAVAGVETPAFAARGAAEPVRAFSQAALADALHRAAQRFDCSPTQLAAADLPEWARESGLPMVAAVAPLGPAAEMLQKLAVAPVLRRWDALAWPHCRRGYFQLRAAIPAILAALTPA